MSLKVNSDILRTKVVLKVPIRSNMSLHETQRRGQTLDIFSLFELRALFPEHEIET